MSIRGMHHTAIIVRDLDRSIYFYHDLLGLDLTQEPSDWMEGDDLARGTGVPGARLRNALLRIGSEATLELLEYANRPADNVAPPAQNRLGAMHLALRVDDIVGKKAELEEGASSSSPISAASTRALWRAGGGCTSTTPTASRSNSWKWRTRTSESDVRGSPSTWLSGPPSRH